MPETATPWNVLFVSLVAPVEFDGHVTLFDNIRFKSPEVYAPLPPETVNHPEPPKFRLLLVTFAPFPSWKDGPIRVRSNVPFTEEVNVPQASG